MVWPAGFDPVTGAALVEFKVREEVAAIASPLALSRADLPQIPDAPAFREWMRQQGIGVVARYLEADRLIPAQGELEMDKVEALQRDPTGAWVDLPILASREAIILDGHHRWAALPPDASALVWIVDLPIRELVRRAFEAPGVKRRDVAGQVVREAQTCTACRDPIPCMHMNADGSLTETGRRLNERIAARAREAFPPGRSEDAWGSCVECRQVCSSASWHHGGPDAAVCRACYNAPDVLHKCDGCDGSAGYEAAGLSLARKLNPE